MPTVVPLATSPIQPAALRAAAPARAPGQHGKSAKPLDRFLRISEVADIVGLGRTTVYRYIRDHGFPAPIPLGGNRVAWLESEVTAWMQTRIANRPAQR